jgi:S1-C subfamily serine protease
MAGNWKGKLAAVGAVGAVAGISFGLGTVVAQQATGVPTAAAPPSPAPTLSTGIRTERANPGSALGPNFIADAAEKISPAVVRIDTEKARQLGNRQIEQMFPDFPGFGNRLPRNYRERGAGSGFILNADGTIVTNAHVVEGADKVTVTLNDGRRLPGKVIGTDSLTDIAIVRVSGGGALPTVRLGDSDRLRPGEFVVAVGNPLGLDHTVTSGIVSALNRSSSEVGVRDKRLDFIQTDAAINPGNSGGPLINIYGEVVGINTAIRADGQGIGFAIPINKVKQISDSLIREGKVVRPYIGVSMVTITPELYEQLKDDPNSGRLPDAQRGVWIREVVPKSPAAKAGLRADDIIVEVDGKPVEDAKQVQDLIGARRVGELVKVKVRRADRYSTFDVRTIEYTGTPVG